MSRPLGQHFLQDMSILQQITDTISAIYQQTQTTSILEIGPGQGALTKHIFTIPQHFHCIEKDTKMKPHLESFLDPTQITRWDVLQTNEKRPQTSDDHMFGNRFSEVDKKLLIVGNLPYYITSPILRLFFTNQQNKPAGGVFLIQKEVADKLVSTTHKKSYLRRLINNNFHITYNFTVPPSAFNPPPKVTSAVISLSHKKQTEITDQETRQKTLDLIAPYSRKTLWRIIKINEKQNITLQIPPSLHHKRLEECTRDDMRSIVILN